jgi:hypothetical protein
MNIPLTYVHCSALPSGDSRYSYKTWSTDKSRSTSTAGDGGSMFLRNIGTHVITTHLTAVDRAGQIFGFLFRWFHP